MPTDPETGTRRGGQPQGLPFVPASFDDLKLPPAEKSVYLHLLRRAGTNGKAWPSIDSIASFCRISPLLVRPILRRLAYWQMIKREERTGRSDMFEILDPTLWRIEPFPAKTTRSWKAPSKKHTPTQNEEVLNPDPSSNRESGPSSNREPDPSSNRGGEGTERNNSNGKNSNTEKAIGYEDFEFPIKNGKFWTMKSSELADLAESFPKVDVMAEAAKARAWLKANPSRRKTQKGMHRFFVGWLTRSSNNPPPSNNRIEQLNKGYGSRSALRSGGKSV